MVAWLGPAISAGASLLGGFMSSNAQKDANAASAAAAAKNQKLQQEFAQKGIRWRVMDAKKAGIHPIYALGANTTSYTPTTQTFTPETGLATGLAAAGQDVGRAINATRTPAERSTAFQETMQALQVKNLELDLDIKRTTLASSIQRLNQNNNPPIPGDVGLIPEATKSDDRPIGLVGGNRIWTDPNTSNVDDFWQKRYGEPGEWLGAAAVGWQDFKHNVRNMSILDMLRAVDRKTRIW